MLNMTVGTSTSKWLKLSFIILNIIISIVHEGEGDYQFSQWAALGIQRPLTRHELDYGNPQTPYTQGYLRTIGSTEYHDINPMVFKNYLIGTYSYLAPQAKSLLHLDFYRIKVDGRVLQGWLHVVVKSQLSIGSIIIHGILDKEKTPSGQSQNNDGVYLFKNPYGGAGEFVHDFPVCDGHDKMDTRNLKAQFTPCGGVPYSHQIMPVGFMYVRDEAGKYGHLVPPGSNTNEIHLNFRLSAQPCSQHKAFKMYAFGIHPEGKDYLQSPCFPVNSNAGDQTDLYSCRSATSTILMLSNLNVIGPAEPVPRPGTFTKVDCSEFINATSDMKMKYVETVHPYGVGGEENAGGKCAPAPEYSFFIEGITKLFSGRCKEKDRQDRGSPDTVNSCVPDTEQKNYKDPSTGNTAEEYITHIKAINEKIKTQCEPCPSPLPPRPLTTTSAPHQTDGITDPPLMADDLLELKKGVEINYETGLEIWDTRILHGIFMVVLSIFICPLNIFITRYFKETYLNTRIMYLRFWYLIHHISIPAYVVLYSGGLWRLVDRRMLAGVSLSLAASLHRGIGWTSIGIMMLMVLFGGIRPINRTFRTYVIAAHWTIGMIIYFMNYSLIILSIWIPGSPAATVDVSTMPTELSFDIVLIITLCWIAFDIIMHVSMTKHICNMDKRLNLTRPRYWFPTPINVLEEHETRDLCGSKFRREMFAAYGTISLSTTLIICAIMCLQDPKDRSLGEMSCTHSGPGESWDGYGDGC